MFDPYKAITQVISYFTGDDPKVTEKKVANILIDIGDSISFGSISAIIDEYAPDTEADIRAAITAEYNRIKTKLNEGYDRQAILSMYSAPQHSVTAQSVSSQLRDIASERADLEKRASNIEGALSKPVRTSEKVRALFGE